MKFQNNTLGEGCRLYTIGYEIFILPNRNRNETNMKGQHFALKFQNNSSEEFVLEDIGFGVVILPEQ